MRTREEYLDREEFEKYHPEAVRVVHLTNYTTGAVWWQFYFCNDSDDFYQLVYSPDGCKGDNEYFIDWAQNTLDSMIWRYENGRKMRDHNNWSWEFDI